MSGRRATTVGLSITARGGPIGNLVAGVSPVSVRVAYPVATMRLLVATVSLFLAGSCGPRHGPVTGASGAITPPPPAPPGSTVVYGPLRIESIDPARSDVGWDRDFVRGSRVVGYDVVLVQDRAACPNAVVEAQAKSDEVGCRGLDAFDPSCKVEPTLRARVEVEVVHALDVAYRCAGDATTFVTDGDPRTALTNAARTCFRNRNKLKPESAWTSLYELTELRVGERIDAVRTPFPTVLSKALKGEARVFCRDDGAYLDGNGGVPSKAVEAPTAALGELVTARATRAQTAPDTTPLTPLTGDAFKTEHALWEECNTPPARASLVATERCLLLRQLDNFLRDVEDLARPETPKGAATGATP